MTVPHDVAALIEALALGVDAAAGIGLLEPFVQVRITAPEKAGTPHCAAPRAAASLAETPTNHGGDS